MLTTDDTRANYTKRELQRADEAARLMRNIGHPSEAVAKQTLGHIDRVRLTTRDIDNALDINGKSVSFLRGKSTRKRPLVARVPPLKRFRVSAQFILIYSLSTKSHTFCLFLCLWDLEL